MAAHESTAGYAEHAEAIAHQYDSVRFADVHRSVLHLLPRRWRRDGA